MYSIYVINGTCIQLHHKHMLLWISWKHDRIQKNCSYMIPNFIFIRLAVFCCLILEMTIVGILYIIKFFYTLRKLKN